ncbi:MAG: carbohydrate-binding protein, partial [Pedobacter sp.]
GVAYHDKDSAEYWVQTQKRTPWNTGGKYRNDGVDIEACADNTSNGYNVGWVETGEWLQYTVLSEQDGIFDINVRNSAKDAGGVLQLLVNNQPSGEPASIASTGKFDQWQTTTIRNIRLSKGSNSIRVLAVNGGFNLNYLQFISASTAAMMK